MGFFFEFPSFRVAWHEMAVRKGSEVHVWPMECPELWIFHFRSRLTQSVLLISGHGEFETGLLHFKKISCSMILGICWDIIIEITYDIGFQIVGDLKPGELPRDFLKKFCSAYTWKSWNPKFFDSRVGDTIPCASVLDNASRIVPRMPASCRKYN